jgi:hypothetical protein
MIAEIINARKIEKNPRWTIFPRESAEVFRDFLCD